MKAEGRLFEEALASLRKWRFLVIGGALWWCCHFLTLYQNDIVSLDPIVGFPDIIWLSCVLATLVVFVVLMFSPRLRRAYGGTRTYIAAFFCVIGGLACFPLAATESALAFAGSLLSGTGIGIVFALYGCLHARCRHRDILLLCAVEQGIALLLFAAVNILEIPAIPVAMVFGTLSLLLMHASSRVGADENREPSVALDANVGQLAFLAFLIGLPYGLVRNMVSQVGEGWASAALPLVLAGTFVAAALLLALYFSRQRWGLVKQFAVVVAPLTAASMALLPLASLNQVVPAIVGNAGFVSFLMLQYYYAAVLSAPSEKPQSKLLFILGVFTLADNSGQLVGALLPSEFASAASSVMIYIILVCCIFLFSRRRDAPSKLHAESIADDSVRLSELSLDDAAFERYDLTMREREVLLLLLNRLTYEEIAERLFISTNTVKTHVGNVYKKTGVSSRKELVSKF